MKYVITFVCDLNYLHLLLRSLNLLKQNGKWENDILLIHNNTINDFNIEKLKNLKLITHSYLIKDIDFSKILLKRQQKNFKIFNQSYSDKIFQFNKFYLFNNFMKLWDRVLYIDSGAYILGDINTIFNIDNTGLLLAHSDAFPTYEWKLRRQFDLEKDFILGEELDKLINLDIDYFQTTIMYYDTSIIDSETFNDLIKIANKYYFSLSNDQGIINIYYNGINKLWKQLPLKDENGNIYDFFNRNKKENYVIVKRYN
jgi:hypothetical protein